MTTSQGARKDCEVCGYELGRPFSVDLSPDEAALIGETVLGRYQIVNALGSGGFGIVYLARHLLLSRRNLFALKILHREYSRQSDIRLRFQREVEILMTLANEHIVPIREFGETEDKNLYFTMDFCPGDSLDAILERETRFPVERALGVTGQILEALEYAHTKQVIHRDLKPANILVERQDDGSDFVRVLDFGIAKCFHDTSGDITQDRILGSPKYMSPEQASRVPVDGRSDLYSLGIILFRMTTGKFPFDADSIPALLMMKLHEEPQTPREVEPGCDIPAGVEAITMKAIAKNRDARFRDAREFHHSVDACLHGEPPEVEPPGPAGRRQRPGRAWPKSRTVLLVVLAICLGLLGWTYLGTPPEIPKDPTPPPDKPGKVEEKKEIKPTVFYRCPFVGCPDRQISHQRPGVCRYCGRKLETVTIEEPEEGTAPEEEGTAPEEEGTTP